MLKLRTTELNGNKICSVFYKDEIWYLASDFFALIRISDKEAFKLISPQSWDIVVVYDEISRDMMPVKIISPAGILRILAKR